MHHLVPMSNSSNYLTKADIKAIGGKITSDEVFKRVKGETGIWVSNYARLISKRRRKPRLLKTVFNNGYRQVSLPHKKYGKMIIKTYYLHILVAKAFCSKPSWAKSNNKLEVHHIKPVDRVNDIPGINNASNLMYVPRTLHKAIDAISEIAVNQDGMWVKMNFTKAAEYYGVTPYDFLNSFANESNTKPNKVEDKYQYYSTTIDCGDNKIVNIDIRIIRRRYELHQTNKELQEK